MTGATIKAEFEDDGFREAIVRVQGLTSDSTELIENIGDKLVNTTRARFRGQKDAFGFEWAPLNPVYEEMKRGPGILREKAMRGGLMGSIVFEVQGPRQVAIGSAKAYAAIHQFGGVIRPTDAKALVFRLGNKVIHCKSVTIPARPYLGFGEADRAAAMAAVQFYLLRALRGS